MNRRNVLTAVLIALALPAAAQNKLDINALKAQGAPALLEALDKKHNDYPTQKWEFKMTLKPVSGGTREFKFSVWQKNRKNRLVRFSDPGEVKGMSVLIVNANEMYVFTPQTDNVRRVAASARRQSFMGSDLGFDDMAQIDLGKDYDAAITTDDAKSLWLELKRKAGSDAGWEKMRLEVDKGLGLITTLEYWESGKPKKKQSRKNVKWDGGAPTFGEITIEDLGTKHRTVLETLTQKIGEAIPDSVFSKRSLVRGN